MRIARGKQIIPFYHKITVPFLTALQIYIYTKEVIETLKTVQGQFLEVNSGVRLAFSVLLPSRGLNRKH
jgi:hypothetical protein